MWILVHKFVQYLCVYSVHLQLWKELCWVLDSERLPQYKKILYFKLHSFTFWPYGSPWQPDRHLPCNTSCIHTDYNIPPKIKTIAPIRTKLLMKTSGQIGRNFSLEWEGCCNNNLFNNNNVNTYSKRYSLVGLNIFFLHMSTPHGGWWYCMSPNLVNMIF